MTTATVDNTVDNTAEDTTRIRKTAKDVKFIIENYQKKGKVRVMEETGLTDGQVYTTWRKARKYLESRIEIETNTDQKQKMQTYLESYLQTTESSIVEQVIDELLDIE